MCYVAVSVVKTYQDIYLCVTNPALCSDKLVNQFAVLTLARPMMMNHRTSTLSGKIEHLVHHLV